VGTDHVNHGVPRAEMEVKGDVWKSVSGFSSRVEAYLQVMLSLGVNQGRISLERMVECCCENNAKVFGLFPKKGTIRVGSDGDIVVVDLNKKATVKPDMLYTSSGWSIYEGWEFTGWPVMTIVRGNIVAEWSNRSNSMEMVGDPVGRYVPRKPGRQFQHNCAQVQKANVQQCSPAVLGRGKRVRAQFQEGNMRRILLGLVVVLSVAAVFSRADGALVRIASAGLSGELLPLWIAQDRGLFKKYGLDTEVITIQGGPLAVQTLLSGSVQFHAGGTSSIVEAKMRG